MTKVNLNVADVKPAVTLYDLGPGEWFQEVVSTTPLVGMVLRPKGEAIAYISDGFFVVGNGWVNRPVRRLSEVNITVK